MDRRKFITVLSAVPLFSSPTEAMTLDLHGGWAKVDFGTASNALQDLIRAWIMKSSDAVTLYYGRFPVPKVNIRITETNGDRVKGGTTYPGDIPLIDVRVGRDAIEANLMHADWVMVHEMIHLAFPWLDGQHNWMAEGIAVYVESVARVQAGHIPRQQVWGDFVTMMPKGLPQDGDGGLEATASWGRTYWGGALFCLLADIRIRQATENAKGLQLALRAINKTRDFRREWDFAESLKLGDAATGFTVLFDMFVEMGGKPVSPDLDSLWKELGVMISGTTVAFDNSQPLAKIRDSIMTA